MCVCVYVGVAWAMKPKNEMVRKGGGRCHRVTEYMLTGVGCRRPSRVTLSPKGNEEGKQGTETTKTKSA